MNSHRKLAWLSAAVAGITLSFNVAVAQNATPSHDGATGARADKSRDDVAKKQDDEWQRTHRASKIIGTEVRNAHDQKVGTVKDLIVDPGSGRVLQVVVAVGGVMGVGDKLFAVPYDKLQPASGRKYVTLSGDSKLAQSFDDRHWPQAGDPRWTMGTSGATTSDGGTTASGAAAPTTSTSTSTSATMSPAATASAATSASTPNAPASTGAPASTSAPSGSSTPSASAPTSDSSGASATPPSTSNGTTTPR
jgi:sporulation protein YlmC with PRC-barrel domain